MYHLAKLVHTPHDAILDFYFIFQTDFAKVEERGGERERVLVILILYTYKLVLTTTFSHN